MSVCFSCNSKRVWKDGIRQTKKGEVQRWLCRNCGYRFSETTKTISSGKFRHSRHDQKLQTLFLITPDANNTGYRVGASEREAKNLVEVESRSEKWPAGATKAKPTSADFKGKIVEYIWWLKKEGYAESTIRVNAELIAVLSKRGANLFNPDSIKDVMAKQKWRHARRHGAIAAYTLFLRMLDRKWNPPICKVTRKLPFIPTEKEIDALIAGCGKKTAAFLQLLKETAMRSGEANSLLWTDMDLERQTITLNKPEKGSNPRIFKASNKLIAMLNALPKKSMRVFGDSLNWRTKASSFYHSRKRLARKLQNPRLLKISFHILRHWKATMLYIQIAETLFKETTDEFTVRVANKPEEITQLLEVGFEFVCQNGDLLYFRKRK